MHVGWRRVRNRRPVVRSHDAGAAYGAALLGGVRAGVWRDVHEAVAACGRVTEVVEPVDGWIEPQREGRQRYRDLSPALRASSVK